MKLPNGYGGVCKLAGKRRKPFCARITVGFVDGKQKYRSIGYYRTKKEALQALAEYNSNPYDLSVKLTFREIYEKWFNSRFDDNSNKSTIKNYQISYKHCKSLHDKVFNDLKLQDLQSIVDGFNNGTGSRIKILLKAMYSYSIKYEYSQKNYADLIEVKQKEHQSEKRAISLDHIELFWSLLDSNDYVGIILILIYSGVRISELLNLKKEDVFLAEQYFKVKESKTSAGVRIVPIASKTLPIWRILMSVPGEYVIQSATGLKLTYTNFSKRYWLPFIRSLNLDYKIHETRHTCNTLLVIANVNPTIRKKIIGHKRQMDIGEAVYTHVYVKELVSAIDKI